MTADLALRAGLGQSGGMSHENEPAALARDAARILTDRAGVERFDIALTLGSGCRRAAVPIADVITSVPGSVLLGFHSSALVCH